MGTVHAKSTNNADTTREVRDVKEANAFLLMPSVVDQVHIEGLERTKTDYILPELKKILEAQTFGEVIAFALEARDQLHSLDIFNSVNVFIDTSQGPKANPNGFDVTLIVKEKRFVTSNIGTQVGNNEGTMVFGVKLNNLFGSAECLKGDLGFGTKTKSSYQVAYTKPLTVDRDSSYRIGAMKIMTDFPSSSHKEESQGLNFSYTLPSSLGQHTFGWDGTWRELTGLEPKTSFSVRNQAGHSLKSSLSHVFMADTRDHPSFPTEGSLFKLTQELAGLGGDVSFVKNNIEIQESIQILQDVVLSWSVQGGLMNNLFNTQSRINDRFFLGGPLSVRGFPMRGIGPKDTDDFLGAEAYWAAGLHLYTPLPFRPAQGRIGDRIRTHIFFNAGNLASLDSSLPWKQQASSLLQNTRWSCGLGLVLVIGIARVELNYCIPRGLQPSDRLILVYSLSTAFIVGYKSVSGSTFYNISKISTV